MMTKLIQAVGVICLLVLAVIQYRTYREAHPTRAEIRAQEDSLARAEFETDTAVNALLAKALPTRADSSRYIDKQVATRGISREQAWRELDRPPHRDPDAWERNLTARHKAFGDSMNGSAFRGHADSAQRVRAIDARMAATIKTLDSSIAAKR